MMILTIAEGSSRDKALWLIVSFAFSSEVWEREMTRVCACAHGRLEMK